MTDNFKAFDHGENQITIDAGGLTVKEYIPTQIHHKSNGSIKDEPSFAIILERFNEPIVMGQISLEMLNNSLEDIGYKIIKTDE